jgi:ribosomal protein S17
MSKTVQITYNTQSFDDWLKRYTQHPTRILAHEPTGYLRVGDVVHFARFTPATMADRFETGKLDRRGGGVRCEVHRVVTPFGEAVEQRKELKGEGELWEKVGSVEFERRKVELTRPWNKDGKRRMAILEGMGEALEMDVEATRTQLGLTTNEHEGQEQSGSVVKDKAPVFSDQTPASEGMFEEMSEAQKDIAAQLQKLQGGSGSGQAAQI